MMSKSLIPLLTLATLIVGVNATSAVAAGQYSSPNSSSSQAAPIVRAYAGQNDGAANANMQRSRQIVSSQPIPGVWLRADPTTAVQTISADAKGAELSIVHGVANVSVHHPDQTARILVDLPGGQIALLKDGIYTFNAGTNTVRVLKGEADAYPGSAVNGIKVKEYHQLAFAADPNGDRSVEIARNDIMADYLPGDGPRMTDSRRPAYGYGPYGDGFYGYPGFAYGGLYPYGFGYPYGYGFGLGFGYYGGFGGFRGGYGGFGRR